MNVSVHVFVSLIWDSLILHQSLWPTESAVIWSEVNQAILSKDWEKATEAKKAVEEREPKWAPKHFILSQTKEGGWDCLPIQKWVPASSIVTL